MRAHACALRGSRTGRCAARALGRAARRRWSTPAHAPDGRNGNASERQARRVERRSLVRVLRRRRRLAQLVASLLCALRNGDGAREVAKALGLARRWVGGE
eukprot:6184717-Pleurochrysis_carterae.AAC.1